MKIIVLSDTHIPARAAAVPEEVCEVLERADLVLHAGDFTDAKTIAYLQGLPRFIGVAGNMDGPQVRHGLRDFEIVEVEGIRIGLIHGWGAPDPLPRMLREHLAGEKLDVIVYGHSHRPACERIDGVLVFNPGSPTDTVFAPYRSYGTLTIEGGRVEGEIVRLRSDGGGKKS
jgi:uncharacterized protein